MFEKQPIKQKSQKPMPLCNNVTNKSSNDSNIKKMYIYRHFLRNRREHTRLERRRSNKGTSVLTVHVPCACCAVPTNKLAHFR